MTTYNYDIDLAVDAAGIPQASVAFDLYDTPGGTIQAITDQGGTLLSHVVSNAFGVTPRFKASVSRGYLSAGILFIPILSLEAQDGAASTAVAASALALASTAIQTSGVDAAIAAVVAGPGPTATALTAAFVRQQVGISTPTPRAGVSQSGGLRGLHDKAWSDLIVGALQTRKTAYATTVRYAATAATVGQTVPGYELLTPGLGGNTMVTTDCGFLTAVTAVYNVTTDAARATNLRTTFNPDVQGLVLTAAPAVGNVIEVQGTVLPYQGLVQYTPPSGYVLFEVIDWDGMVMQTTDGTGGATKAAAGVAMMSTYPVMAKLPMPSGVVNADFWCEPVQPGPNAALTGASKRDIYMGASIAENQPILTHAGGAYLRFREGLQFNSSIAWGRGFKTTNPTVHMFVWTLSPGGPYPNKHANVLHALVRVVSNLVADSALYPVGRVFLMVSTTRNVSGGGLAGTLGNGESATDFFALPTPIDNFDRMVTL